MSVNSEITNPASAAGLDAGSGMSGGDNNWDEYLDSYERVVDKLVAMVPKIKSGDPSVLAEYGELVQEESD